MALLTDDQKMLRETAASFLAEEGSISKQLRHLRDTGCTDGYGTALWKQFGELGLTGICIPESVGGIGMGAVEAALVLEEIGRNLTPSPFLTTAVVATRAIEGTVVTDFDRPGIAFDAHGLSLGAPSRFVSLRSLNERGGGQISDSSRSFASTSSFDGSTWCDESGYTTTGMFVRPEMSRATSAADGSVTRSTYVYSTPSSSS